MMQRLRPLAASLRLRTPTSAAFAFAPSSSSSSSSPRFYSATADPSPQAADPLSATPPASETAPPYFVPRTAGGELVSLRFLSLLGLDFCVAHPNMRVPCSPCTPTSGTAARESTPSSARPAETSACVPAPSLASFLRPPFERDGC
jgi:hypothetical protein